MSEATLENKVVSFSLKDSARDANLRINPFKGMPESVDEMYKHLSGDSNIEKALETEEDKALLKECIEAGRHEYGLNREKGYVPKILDAADKACYFAQLAIGDGGLLAFPLFGATTKLTTVLARMAVNALYAPYYFADTGVNGLKAAPDYLARKTAGLLLPGGTVVDQMSLRDQQKWMALEYGKRKFLEQKGMYKAKPKPVEPVAEKRNGLNIVPLGTQAALAYS